LWFPGKTAEQRIQAAIDAAAADRVGTVFVPPGMLPYDSSKVSFRSGIRMVRQEGDTGAYDVLAYGAAGDGQTDDTEAIGTAVQACPENGTLIFPSGRSYVIGTVSINKNIVFQALGATFLLRGAGAGFVVQSVISFFRVSGGTYVGSGNGEDRQIGWLFGNVPEADISNVVVDNITVRDCAIGVKVAGEPDKPVRDLTVRSSRFVNMVGELPGIGLGFNCHHADYAKALGNHFERCERHSLYFSLGKHYVAASNTFKDHRITVASGAMRVAFAVARSDNVTAMNNLFDNCFDGAVGIETDEYGRHCRNVVFTGNTFLNSRAIDIMVGLTIPSTAGFPQSVVINGNAFRRDSDIEPNTMIDIRSGSHVNIANNNFFHEATTGGTFACIFFRGSEGSQFTDQVAINGNIIRAASSAGRAYALELSSVVAQGTSTIDYVNNLDHSSDGVLFDAELRNPNFRMSS
jgi:hypothetical protein